MSRAPASANQVQALIVSKGLWDNSAFLDRRGINTLTGAESVAPFGGAAFHDIRVFAEPDRPAAEETPRRRGNELLRDCDGP